jgi:hypothetical protein
MATGLSLLTLASGCGELELPPPPDMSELQQAYANPDGELSADSAMDFGKTVVRTIVEKRRTSPVEMVGSIVENLQDLGGGKIAAPPPENAGAGEQEVNGSRIDLAAIARVHRICRGWADDPVNEAENGSLDLTVTLDQAGLIPTIWGTTNHCRFPRGDFDIEMDGALRLNFGDGEPRVGLRYLAQLSYLFGFEGTVGVTEGGELTELTLNSHFKVNTEENEVMFLMTLTDGSRVVGLVKPAVLAPAGDDTVMIGVIGRDKELWQCKVDTLRGTGECSSDQSSGISW